MIIDKLIEKIKETQNPTVVGLDPRLDYVPEHIKEEAFAKHGETLQAVAQAFYAFNRRLIDALYDIVPAVKPQIAMYEQYGYEGIRAFIDTIAYAKEKGLIVIGDVKRSDIASTAEAYADGHIGRVNTGKHTQEVYREDFITLNPYLGFDSIEPYLENCKKYEKGLFILVKTSNPHSGELQDLMVEREGRGGETLYETVGELVAKWGKELIGVHGFSEVGAVVGATHREQAKRLRARMPDTFFLVPGYGAQGGTAEDIEPCYRQDGLGVIVNSSRGIIAAYQNERYRTAFGPEDFAGAARQAALDMKKDLSWGERYA